jgi:hypothetical protein
VRPAVKPPLAALTLAVASTCALSCGTTGDELITFPAYAQGASGAGDPFTVNGYTVQLTFAQMYIGGLYLNEAPAGPTFDSPECISSGIYAAQLPGTVELNLLSTTPQPFSVMGSGTADLAQSWELWLTTGDVDDPVNTGSGVPHIVDLQGTATRQTDGAQFPFAATVTIDQRNRGVPVSDPSQPGLNPICKQRIIEAGGISQPLFAGGQLTVTVDPRGWFNVPLDFSTLPLVSSDACETDPSSIDGNARSCIPDTSLGSGAGATQGATLFTGIRTGGTAAYTLQFTK